MPTELDKLFQMPEQIARELCDAFTASVDQQIAEGEGELTEAETSAIVKYTDESSIELKDNCAEAILRCDEIAAQLDAKAKQVAAAAKRWRSLGSRMRWGIKTYFENRGVIGVQGLEHKLRVRKNPTKLVIVDELLPDEYREVPPILYLSQKALRYMAGVCDLKRSDIEAWCRVVGEFAHAQKPDRLKIEAALDSGKEVPGAHYEQSTRLHVE